MEEGILSLFQSDVQVINLGLESFAHTLEEKGVNVLHVHWSPPAGGDEELMAILDILKD